MEERTMNMKFEYVSLPAFALACTIHFVAAAIWYSKPLFGARCGKLAFGSRAPPKPNRIAILATVFGGLMAYPFFSFVLSAVDCRTPVEGALWGLAFGLFFDTGLNASHTFFENRSFELFAIHRGCHAVSLIATGAILATLCGAMPD